MPRSHFHFFPTEDLAPSGSAPKRNQEDRARSRNSWNQRKTGDTEKQAQKLTDRQNMRLRREREEKRAPQRREKKTSRTEPGGTRFKTTKQSRARLGMAEPEHTALRGFLWINAASSVGSPAQVRCPNPVGQ